MAETKKETTATAAATEERVQPIRFTDEETGTVYTLDFCRESAVFAQQRGFDADKITSAPTIELPNLFYYAMRMHHKNLARTQTDHLYFDVLGGLTGEMIERLAMLYNQAALTHVIQTKDDLAKKRPRDSGDVTEQEQAPLSLRELFEHDCPYYMAMGMTYEQYWYGDVWMVKAFREADELRKREANERLWLQGMYICEAVGVAVVNAFPSSWRGGKTLRYSDKPYDIYKHSQSQVAEDARRAEKEEQRKKAVAYFNSFAKTPKKL